MQGNVSTSLDKDQAIGYATRNLQQGKISVLQEILWKKNATYMRLDNDELTTYPSEKEVLLNDGESFRVLEVNKNY